jgi:hypothetical protein
MAIKVWGAGTLLGSDGQWDNPQNWSDDTIPQNLDSILFDGSASYPVTTCPTSSIIIENITFSSSVTMASNGVNILGPSGEPLLIYGSMINNSSEIVYFPIHPFGVSSVIGKFRIFSSFSPLYNIDGYYFSNLNVIFDNDNYINFDYYNARLPILYGVLDTFTGTISPYGGFSGSFGGPLDSFSVNCQNYSSIGIDGWLVSGIVSISALNINFTNTKITDPFTFILPNFVCNFFNYNSTFQSSFIVEQRPDQDKNIWFAPLGSTGVVISIESSVAGNYFQRSEFGICYYSIVSTGDTNVQLKGSARLFAIEPDRFAQSTSYYQMLNFFGSTNSITAYDNSSVCGIYNANAAGFSNLEFSLPVSYITVSMQDNSIFCGICIGQNPSVLNFLENSQYSNAYLITPGFFPQPTSISFLDPSQPIYERGIQLYKSSF